MKKLVILLSICALIGASSCKKAYTCNCYNTNTRGTIPFTVTSTSSWQADIKCALHDNDSLSCSI